MDKAFVVGQEVAVFSTSDRLEEISSVEKIVRKTIHVEGQTIPYDLGGTQKTSGFRRGRIVAVKQEHRDVLTRRHLWDKLDTALGTHAGAARREEARDEVSTETLAKIVELLHPDLERDT